MYTPPHHLPNPTGYWNHVTGHHFLPEDPTLPHSFGVGHLNSSSDSSSSEEECYQVRLRRIMRQSQHRQFYKEEIRRRKRWDRDFERKEETLSDKLNQEDAFSIIEALDRQREYESSYRKQWNSWYRARDNELKGRPLQPRQTESKDSKEIISSDWEARGYDSKRGPVKGRSETEYQPKGQRATESKGWLKMRNLGPSPPQEQTASETRSCFFGNDAHQREDESDKERGEDQRRADSRPKPKPKKKQPPKKTQRPPLFEQHMPEELVNAKILAGELFVAIAKVSPSNRQRLYCATLENNDTDEPDVLVDGWCHQNRCLHGDKIAVQILPEDQWQLVEPEPHDWGHEEDEDDSTPKRRRTGKVVAILERKQQGIIGCFRRLARLGEDPPPSQKNILFHPSHHYYPLISVPIPTEVQRDPESFRNIKYLVQIHHWNVDHKLPAGTLIRKIGGVEEIASETESILIEHMIDAAEFEPLLTEEFKEEVLVITPEDLKERKDLRSYRIFTIDPATARDLDDACHVVPLPNGNFEVGVHIADVSHYVKPGTALDELARQRTTSVYLVNRVIPMLPHVLSQNLCSLNPGVPRFACSVIWELTPEGDIKSQWIGKTIIQSVAKLSYEHAQQVILEFDTGVEVIRQHVMGQDPVAVGKDIVTLQKIAAHLRAKRFENGALSLGNKMKLAFDLDESETPTAFTLTAAKESNQLIEEFMLLANISVAKFIFDAFPEHAVLRRHEPPEEKKINKFKEFCSAMKLDAVDCSNSKAFNTSLQQIPIHHPHLAGLTEVITELATKSMQQAQYFCAAEYHEAGFHHYALNVPFYTHFTSPIRRYPDILVHRLVWATTQRQAQEAASASALSQPSQFNLSAYGVEGSRSLRELIERCNEKKRVARQASRLSSNLFLAIFVKHKPITDPNCIVYQIEKPGRLTFYSPLLGISDHIYIGRSTHLSTFKDNVLSITPHFCPTCNAVWHLSKKNPVCTQEPVPLLPCNPLRIELYSTVTVEITMREKSSPPSFKSEIVHHFFEGVKDEWDHLTAEDPILEPLEEDPNMPPLEVVLD